MNLILQHVCFQVYIKYLMGVLANIVTSQFDLEAQNYSMQALPHLEKRYERADEFINVMKNYGNHLL